MTFTPLRVSTQSDEELEIVPTPSAIVPVAWVTPPALSTPIVSVAIIGKVPVSSGMGTAPSASLVLRGAGSFLALRGAKASSTSRGASFLQGTFVHRAFISHTRIDEGWSIGSRSVRTRHCTIH